MSSSMPAFTFSHLREGPTPQRSGDVCALQWCCERREERTGSGCPRDEFTHLTASHHLARGLAPSRSRGMVVIATRSTNLFVASIPAYVLTLGEAAWLGDPSTLLPEWYLCSI